MDEYKMDGWYIRKILLDKIHQSYFYSYMHDNSYFYMHGWDIPGIPFIECKFENNKSLFLYAWQNEGCQIDKKKVNVMRNVMSQGSAINWLEAIRSITGFQNFPFTTQDQFFFIMIALFQYIAMSEIWKIRWGQS